MPDMTLCEQCGKEQAAVFVSRKNGDAETKQALCLQCAEKRKIPSVKEFIRQNKSAEFRMCEQCGELPAMIFVSTAKDGKAQEKQALCGFCAREQHIPQVEETLAQMDIPEEELRRLHEELMQQPQKPKGILQKLRAYFKG